MKRLKFKIPTIKSIKAGCRFIQVSAAKRYRIQICDECETVSVATNRYKVYRNGIGVVGRFKLQKGKRT